MSYEFSQEMLSILEAYPSDELEVDVDPFSLGLSPAAATVVFKSWGVQPLYKSDRWRTQPRDAITGEFLAEVGAQVELLDPQSMKKSGRESKKKLGKSHLWRELSEQQVDHLRLYSEHGSEEINAKLRSGKLPSGDLGDAVRSIDESMRPLEDDIVVFRNGSTRISPQKMLGLPKGTNLIEAIGRTYKDRGFVSTSTDSYWGDDAYGLEIRVPKGVDAVWMNASISEEGYTISTHPEESEVLLNRGLTYRVIGVLEIVDGSRILRMEVV